MTGALRAACSVFAVILAVLQVPALADPPGDRITRTALAVGEAGAEAAREKLRLALKGGATFSSLLATAANGGTLVDATQLAAFNGSTGLINATPNAPFIAPSGFGAGHFQVFLTNDRGEPGAANASASVQSQVDTNNRVMVTSFGSGPGGTAATIQEELQLLQAFLAGSNMPGVIILPGPMVNFATSNSSASSINGGDFSVLGSCYPTIAVSTNAAKLYVDQLICGNNNVPYGSCGPYGGAYTCSKSNPALDSQPSTENFLPTALNPYDPTSPNSAPLQAWDQHLIRVDYLKSLVQSIMAVADFHELTDPGFTGGTATDPKIIAINHSQDFPNYWTGYGILLVTGTLKFRGEYAFHGLILAVGDGVYVHGGTNGAYVWGTMLVANINTPWQVDPRFVGVPSYSELGGGPTVLQYSSGDLMRYAASLMPLQRTSFQLLR